MLLSEPMQGFPQLLAFTDGDVWRPGIGDPTVMGWLTVVAYFAAALLSLRECLVVGQKRGGRQSALFWGTLALVLVALGFNKQLDLQTFLTLTGRRIAIEMGWYGYRRIAQLLFLAIVAAVGFMSFLMMRKLVRRHPELRLPLAGFVMLMVFVVMRAASFHHFDQVINFRMAGVRMNWVLELGAIILIVWGARRSRADRRSAPGASGRQSSGRFAPAR